MQEFQYRKNIVRDPATSAVPTPEYNFEDIVQFRCEAPTGNLMGGAMSEVSDVALTCARWPESRWSRNFGAPVLGVCGYSGAGKTTLIEAAIPHLVARGLAIAVVKHDAHGFSVDCPGKDSDRFFRAGATVALRGPGEQFQRRGASARLTLGATLAELARDHDLILVEGHKDTDLPKLWLGDERNSLPPQEVTEVLKILPWQTERLGIFLSFIERWLLRSWSVRPLFAGLLVGGKSARMGRPKQLLEFRGRTLAEIAVSALSVALPDCTSPVEPDVISNPKMAILGAGALPLSLQEITRLADPPGLAGPLAGLLAAHRWNPQATWIVTACDHPWLCQSDVQRLLDQRKPGTWTVMLRQADGHPYPTFALFEPQSLVTLERAILDLGAENVQIAELFEHPRTVILPHSTRGLFNTDTPMEFSFASQLSTKSSRISSNQNSRERGMYKAQLAHREFSGRMSDECS